MLLWLPEMTGMSLVLLAGCNMLTGPVRNEHVGAVHEAYLLVTRGVERGLKQPELVKEKGLG